MLPKKHRVTTNKEFRQIYAKGRFHKGPFFNLKLIPNKLDFSRFGVVISKKTLAKATARNQVKRQVRESLKDLKPKFKPGFDVVIIITTSPGERSFATIKEQVTQKLKEAGVL